MENLLEYLDTVNNMEQRKRLIEIFEYILEKYELETRIAWNQPMFTQHGTFIIGFSVLKNHISMSPEIQTMIALEDEIKASGYERTKMLIKIKNDEAVNYDLIDMLITYNINDKKDVNTFWRKN